jgi:copper chaperone
MSNEIKLSVPAMMCGGCVSSINKALDAEAHVVSANVDLPTKTVLVETDASAAFLIDTLKTAGYEATEVS